MRKKFFGLVHLFLLFIVVSANGESITIHWGGDAEKVYDLGFMHKLMKNSAGGVSLFCMDLIQNDAPGAGRSEKGVWTDIVWGKFHARKLLYLDDPHAYKAWLLIFTVQQGKYPLKFRVNGNLNKIDNWDTNKNRETYRWVEFPAEWLKKGKNVIELFCPEAATEDEDWEIYLARADEFEAGGGDPSDVGKTSFKSSDGGKSWKQSPFGSQGNTRAEYSIRLSLDRYVMDLCHDDLPLMC